MGWGGGQSILYFYSTFFSTFTGIFPFAPLYLVQNPNRIECRTCKVGFCALATCPILNPPLLPQPLHALYVLCLSLSICEIGSPQFPFGKFLSIFSFPPFKWGGPPELSVGPTPMKGKDEEIEGIYQKEMEGIQIPLLWLFLTYEPPLLLLGFFSSSGIYLYITNTFNF